mgnify:FL=1|tara:strand:- start:245 stop:409 length:165 start_codon:yes stop_codon:yes gene_type:complete
MIKVKMMMTLHIDEEDYPIPADQNVAEELETSMTEFIYDIGGVTIKNIRTLQET